ncbi:MAG: (2Fe-2S)-binding protein [Flavobacteriales bacterium]|nr:(2Fe-2S)-binding protein [Flavobacteriales bacterium]MCX7768179.1 (2Fe-2S)-binding protein [Flavobacteriales bacterium]MDW8409130.1 2Fe-2S iron-sulfur cluster-binding protein [Flavobacteriales bacterium]
MTDAVFMTVVDREGRVHRQEVPLNVSMNLMELLKAQGYPVEGVCGGMAMCATCHVEVQRGMEKLPPLNEAEQAMLDALPKSYPSSRLACQIPLSEALQDVVIRLAETD